MVLGRAGEGCCRRRKEQGEQEQQRQQQRPERRSRAERAYATDDEDPGAKGGTGRAGSASRHAAGSRGLRADGQEAARQGRGLASHQDRSDAGYLTRNPCRRSTARSPAGPQAHPAALTLLLLVDRGVAAPPFGGCLGAARKFRPLAPPLLIWPAVQNLPFRSWACCSLARPGQLEPGCCE
ncbi:hypothetical protein P153DRAFT_48918 [Dothidotthia symphoricarpi CBS 119687]|uniref:Uncharacterized protein n=1 Tax=Dothidotthia symphoricarpi CBS 119687 TaxID=1392245 RepID=A0A6A6AAN6_9PLEO|nr:uncharacterized protein P153DRAFT_48918 [Dothidotthia symphoricarpi CBS 119687]KAF2128144.1 hypothetical protein P153DRAFT_48918 [Dothidotthia symphoricarpi CBS 119687]